MGNIFISKDDSDHPDFRPSKRHTCDDGHRYVEVRRSQREEKSMESYTPPPQLIPQNVEFYDSVDIEVTRRWIEVKYKCSVCGDTYFAEESED